MSRQHVRSWSGMSGMGGNRKLPGPLSLTVPDDDG
jgi:hypothetical protein